jgi:hypothetical protein
MFVPKGGAKVGIKAEPITEQLAPRSIEKKVYTREKKAVLLCRFFENDTKVCE